MEGLSNKSRAKTVASSGVWTFLVGPKKEEFIVHSALLVQKSPVLKAMMESGLRETQSQTVEWDDIDVNVFLSFWQYIYTGSYENSILADDEQSQPAHEEQGSVATPAAFEIAVPVSDGTNDPSAPSNGTDEPSVFPSSDSTIKIKKKKKGKKGQHQLAYPAGQEPSYPSPRVYEWPAPYQSPEVYHDPLEGTQAHRDSYGRYHGRLLNDTAVSKSSLWSKFSNLCPSSFPEESQTSARPEAVNPDANILKHHAQVYVLAERYDIAHLMDIAFWKLHRSLVELKPSITSTDNVMELMWFCFDEPTPDKLKDLMTLYAACRAKELWASEYFGKLMELSGEFSKAVMHAMMHRID